MTIRRPGKACAECGVPFADGQDHYSVLRRDPAEEEWLRQDFCLGCWDGVLDRVDGHDLHGLWRTRYTDRDGPRRTPVHEYTPLLEICYDALASADLEQQGLAYLSAMVLRRQKIFRLIRRETDPTTDQGLLWFYDKANEAEVRVPDPPMTLDDLRATRRVLQERLTPTEAAGGAVPDTGGDA